MLILGIILIVFGFALILFLVFKLSTQLNQQFASINQQLNERLKDNTDTLLKTQQDITQRLNKVSDVEKSLTRMEETYKQVLDVSKDIASLQDLLRAPKFRGGFGESSLENILSQIMPKEFFAMQYSFKNGTKADAVIKIGQSIVAVDAKFPLESFKRMAGSGSDDERRINRKQFLKDVQNRIDEISDKYILPDEKTYEFALMFIPAENVYYETIIKNADENDQKSIYAYALEKKVIPVSPQSLYQYLLVIIKGLKGLSLEKNVKKVMEDIGRLHVDLDKFKEDFRLVGSHITNAKTKFEDAERKLNRFSDKFDSSHEIKD